MSRPTRLPPALAVLFAVALPFARSSAQDITPEKAVDPKVIAATILKWVSSFQAGDIRMQGRIVVAADIPVEYIRMGVAGGILEVPDVYKITTHLTLLQHLIGWVEKRPTPETGAALLAVASVGFAKNMFDHRMVMVRDLGHFALLRIDSAAVWSGIHEIATTDPPAPESLDEDEEFDADARAMWRVAAVRLLGMKEKGVFRNSVEKCLLKIDGRVRLAAAESLRALHSKASLPAVTRALGSDDHPMVVVALVQAMQRILSKHADDIEAAKSEQALRTALGVLSKHGWRADMAIVQLLHNHPIKAAVPRLIGVMWQSRGEADPILKILNENASRFLGLEAHRALRKITGALVADDPAKWQEFWVKEKDKIVVERRVMLDKRRTVVAAATGGSFYGIPVLGCDVVFVLDASGSMKARVKAKITGPTTGPTGVKTTTLTGTRLSVARRQTIKAVQGMPKNSRFSIVTFNSSVRAWNREPVKSRGSAHRTVARILGRLRPRGGTNVFDALIHVLRAKNAKYGDEATNVDEIFILSDGQPSAGELTAPDDILRVVREINKTRRVRIHTVFAGEGAGADFMRRLAAENNGKFVQQ